MNREESQNKSQERETRNGDSRHAGNTLYVSNLSSKVNTEKLEELFKGYGTIQRCYIISNPITGESRNFGFVSFASPEDAQNALNKCNKRELEGREIKVELARRDEPHEPTPGEYKGVSNILSKSNRYFYRKRGIDKVYDRRRYEPRRYNPYYRERRNDFGRNGYGNYPDRNRYRFRGYHKSDRISRSSRSIDRRSYNRRSYEGKSYDRKSYDRKSYDRRSYDRRSNDRRSIDRRSVDRRSGDRRSNDKKRISKRRADRYSSDRSRQSHKSYDKYKRNGKGFVRHPEDGSPYFKNDKRKKSKYEKSRRSVSNSGNKRRGYRDSMS